MENNELIRRAEDLCERCGRSGSVTMTGFLTPAERYELQKWAERSADCEFVFCGGAEDSERSAAFFLPYYMDIADFEPSEYIRAIRLKAFFGEPGHRDYMGAILGMGVGREWVGDISVRGGEAYVFCLPSILRHLLSIDKVGRYTVRAEEISLKDVPAEPKKVQQHSFSVMSMRLDAVAGGMFRLSRTESAKHIAAGNVSLNYAPCEKTDAVVKEGDIISLKGAGKGRVTGTGGVSRKGRLFVYTEIYK